MLTNIVRRMLSRSVVFAAAALVALGFATSAAQAAPPAQTANAVQIQSFAFNPNSLTAPVGTTVTWTNNDSAPHTATARDGSFDTGQMAQGESKSVTLNTAGTFEYFCAVHPRMVATLIVGAAQAPATMPNTGLSDAPTALLATLGALALLAGGGISAALRRRSIVG